MQNAVPPASARVGRRPSLTVETLALLTGAYFALVFNRSFWTAAFEQPSWADPATWRFGAALLVALASLHVLLLAPVLHRVTARWIIGALVIAAAIGTYYMQTFGVYLDPGMLRNALHSEPKEALDLIGGALLAHVLIQAGPALALLAWIRIRRTTLRAALLRRVGLMATAGVLLALSTVISYQELSGLFRNHKEVRYLITPANLVYAAASTLLHDGRAVAGPRVVVGSDARLSAAGQSRTRPVLLMIVVGETARAANWGLNGYERDTTPALRRLATDRPDDLVNFSQVTACGTDTETSVPCLFSAVGRRRYDEQRIRGSESLLHVLTRAGYRVRWRDNQTGCKGVCSGLPFEQVDIGQPDCAPGNCLDEKLLAGLEPPDPTGGPDGSPGEVIVLHQLGNHGPAYFKRYPDSFRIHTPTCDTAELRRCSTTEIRNSYDNALRYTDHFLAQAIEFLKSRSATHDTALIYVSDHGESLGESGLFLHGVPYAIAPSVQTRVPMVIWTSPGLRTAVGLDAGCLAAKADRPVSHDHLFHTVLGLLQVESTVREATLDLVESCRTAHAARAGRPD